MTTWTEQEITEAAKLWRDGWSSGRISAKVGHPRNSVCSLARRLRDRFPSRKIEKRGLTVPTAKRQPKAVVKKPVAAKPVPKPVVVPPAPVAVIDAATRRPATFLKVTDRQCKWPLWSAYENPGPDGLCCGEEIELGAVYCTHHKRLAFGKGTESERRAVKVLERAAA